MTEKPEQGAPLRDGLPVQAPSPDGLGHSAGIPSAAGPCPSCGALPCDWTQNPFVDQRATIHSVGNSSARSTCSEILQALRERSAYDHIQVEEFAFTGGYRRIDFWDLHVHPSKGHEATSYEIKVSRADFKRDSAIKQREARLWSDRFYYVCPKGLVKPEEIPEWAGLMEWDGSRLSIKLPAPKRDKDAPSWDLFVSLIRNSTAVRRDEDPRLRAFRYYESRNKQLEAENRALQQRIWTHESAVHAPEKE